MKWLFGVVCWVIIVEILRKISNSEWNLIFSHITCMVELAILSVYFFYLLSKKKRAFLYVGVLIYATAIIASIVMNPAFFIGKNRIDAVLYDILATVWAVLFFQELIQKPLRYNIKIDGNFWSNCGHILYYPGTILIFGLGRYVENLNHDLWETIKSLHHWLNLIMYFSYLIAFIMDRNTNKIKRDFA